MKTRKTEIEPMEQPAADLARDEAEEARGGIIIVNSRTERLPKSPLSPQAPRELPPSE